MREMKDSGVPWIGEIHKDWRATAIKRYCQDIFAGGTPRSSNPDFWDGDIPWIPSGSCHDTVIVSAPKSITKAGFESSSTKLIPAGTTVMAMTGATCANMGFVSFSTCANQSVAAFIPRESCYSKFLFYALYAARQHILTFQTGGAQAGINIENCKNFIIPFIPYDEQQRIADFLDTKCSKIDSILEKTRASIEEYKKLKQSVITEAVTKGIRGRRPMQDPGIKWVESIPIEWKPVNPKALFAQRKEKAHPGERQLASSQQYGIIYQDDYMALTGAKIVTVEKDFDILKHVEAGDFVISMRSFQGGLEYSENTGSISSAYVMLRPNPGRVFNRFYKWLFKSQVYIDALCSTSNMVRDGQAMRYSNFAQVRLYAVPMDEQQEIAIYLDEKCATIDSLIASKEALITELESYKKSIIYEYVTGKKEVPEAKSV